MVLKVVFAKPDDVDRITEIHLLAFDTNPLLHVQFPTASSLQSLKEILSLDMLLSIQAGEASGRVVLVIRDSEADDKIISFAKWDLPNLSEKAEIHPEVSWPPDCSVEYLDGYHKLAEDMKNRVVGDRRCYRMTFVGTDPAHVGRGAATLLTRWGLDRAEKERVVVYLESTTCAVSLYKRLGFVSVEKLTLELPGHVVDGKSVVYEEEGMLRQWKDN